MGEQTRRRRCSEDRTGRTRRRFLTATSVAFAAGLAGCQDTTDAGDPDTNDGASSSLEPPTGTSEDGIDDPTALVDATQEALSANDYALEQELVNAVDGEESLAVTQRRRSSLEDERRLFVFDAQSETNRRYIEGDTVYSRWTSDGETTVGSSEARRAFAETHPPELLGGSESLGGIVETGTYTPGETARRNDRRVLRFDLESADESAVSGTVTEATGTVFVDADSVVHDASRSLTVEEDGVTTTVEQSFVVHELGAVDVQRPDWFEAARNAGD
ncbi:hypothetical protein C488_16117 [Natrinema pellirubrum DSM 15624]|uniref:Uncharacterized protein n=1 Tax=Natrinema pellirubrum (strain DSM 15624 / CIP 106293 / JCM 10476 / NCIMB 786 / 157) TaxID=797303 RepID=L0JNJ7_NATP1|nr:hypothetical protein [Natrinema pellirubrum]AGB33110.1 hypothetical protein Natpe_3323 [Natrinema pellirubrum DSM 15624]ELY71774.1 hypothetical protein C488_16117 [Natrinema pellirubrum DSM 15624]